jgi:hypothetical protein
VLADAELEVSAGIAVEAPVAGAARASSGHGIRLEDTGAVEAQHRLRRRRQIRRPAQRLAMGLRAVLLVRRAVADVAADDDQRRAVARWPEFAFCTWSMDSVR